MVPLQQVWEYQLYGDPSQQPPPLNKTRNGIGDNAVTAYGIVNIVWNAIAVWKATFYSQNSHVRFAVVSTYILMK